MPYKGRTCLIKETFLIKWNSLVREIHYKGNLLSREIPCKGKSLVKENPA
jgi:hypothetical protein